MTLPLSEKYRPQSLTDIIGNEEVISVLKKMLDNESMPNMLFCGPPGTGKTTSIRAIARGIYKKHYSSSVLELNASNERGIETVRSTIKAFANTVSFSNQMKLVILDEADSMSRDAQNAMRRIIEDFSGNARFCFIVNYASRIIPAIQSRCTKFRFSPVRGNIIKERIKDICQNEDIQHTDEGIEILAEACNGDIRKMVNDIQGIVSCYGSITADNVYAMNGIVDKKVFNDIYQILMTSSFAQCKKECIFLKDKYSIDCESLISNISEIVINSLDKRKLEKLKLMSDIQYRLSLGCSQEIQLNAFISVFLLTSQKINN